MRSQLGQRDRLHVSRVGRRYSMPAFMQTLASHCRLLAVAMGLSPAMVLALAAAPAHADIFYLTSGGRIEGRWLNQDEQPPTQYLILTASGLKTSLQLTQVREVVRQSPLDAEYARRAALAADTSEGQWQLSEWCRQQSLVDQRKAHLGRVIELDPEHSQARRALGFQFLDGRWITRDSFHRQKGYELYKGKWRTPQEIEILEEQARVELAQRDWLKKLRRYRAELDDPALAKLAYESLVGIKDPLAVQPLAALFAREQQRRVKVIFADVLANIDSADAIAALVNRTLYDIDEEVFHYSLARLIERRPPRLADPFILALKDKNNAIVNRAAYSLGQISDREAIAPLIDALITTHAQAMPSRKPESTTTTFTSGGSSVSSGGGPQVLILHVRNQHVLDALTKITGANFNYDKDRWHYWHSQEKKTSESSQPVVDARQ